MSGSRRRFGGIRRLASGRWQAYYQAPDGRRRVAETTFDTKTDADRWLAVLRSTLLEDRWRDPALGRERLACFLARWIEERSGLRPRTRELYRWLLIKYIEPSLGRRELRHIDTASVRAWRAMLLTDGVSESMTAKSYRLLRAALTTAVDDGLLPINPCRIRGAGTESPAERPTLTIAQVVELSKEVPARFEAMIMLTTFASLRWGEVTALRRRDIDLTRSSVIVTTALVELRGKAPQLGPPKSRAGMRIIGVPRQVVDMLRGHLDAYVDPGADSYVFTGPKGGILRRGNFNPLVRWHAATGAIGAPGLHFHDLRHTGNVLAAQVPGTSTRDLMRRMGHDSMRAALIYQHLTADADQRVSDGLTTQLTAMGATRRSFESARSVHAEGRARRDA